MSAYKIQTPGNYPKESIQHTEHSESLKLRDYFTFTLDFLMRVICGNEDRKNTDDGQLYKKPGFWVHIQLHRCLFAIRFVLIIVLL